MKNQKGFTLIELIIVLAIIGIMLSVTLVSMNSGSSKIKRANETAKSFYTVMQGTLVAMRFDGEKVNEGFDLFITVEINEDTHKVQQARVGDTKDTINQSNFNGGNSDFTARLAEKLNKRMGNDYHGYFYLKVNEKFKVQSVYWSETALNFSANPIFTKDNNYNNNIIGAFPYRYGKAGDPTGNSVLLN